MKKITLPMALKKSHVKQIPISKLKVSALSISEENAIVGYFDILGYSFKTDCEDSKHSVLSSLYLHIKIVNIPQWYPNSNKLVRSSPISVHIRRSYDKGVFKYEWLCPW